MLIYLCANLDRLSINLQLNSLVVVIHVDVADGEHTRVHHTQIPDHPAPPLLIINNVILTDRRLSRWCGSDPDPARCPSSAELRTSILGYSPEPKPGCKNEAILGWCSRCWKWWLCLWALCIQLEGAEKHSQVTVQLGFMGSNGPLTDFYLRRS